ncbi:type III secretion system inner membrane ring lipoprotein SctJ [Robbsia betulipollinis]|uniref:type III secretion system inner membrane ring lipoprotein SctJ n=1 Tax=Robbsia betulipollinis TaxID=2981849 RepID=UPI0025464BAC|nr:type III secretion inner membrane ring lipoprotein SctJ [Robbsia betulipollinis]
MNRAAKCRPDLLRWMMPRMVLLLGMLTLLASLAACGARVELMGAVPEDEANEIMSTLLNAGVSVDKRIAKAGVTLSVPSDQVSRALDVMRAHGLPRERFTGMGNVFRKEGLVSSALEERARYVFALSQELGETLSQIDGVVSARVHVVLPERGNINEAATPATAAVFIKHKAGMSLDALQPHIRQMVANGIPGLSADHVTVFMVASPAAPVPAAIAWRTVLGLHVAAESVQALWCWMVLAFAATCALAGSLGWVYWRAARASGR